MAQPRIQPSFNSGEWSPKLYSRVDLEKYRSAAALLRNFIVDYRGGASTRPGTKYILRAFDSTNNVRVVPFQASFTVAYVLEFGDGYIRFYYQGAPVLESALTITAATKANPCVLSVVNSLSDGDWVYVTGVSGMTQLNGHYYIVSGATGTSIALKDLFGTNINSTSFSTYTSGGTVQRVYKITSPYVSADLFTLKFSQDTTDLIITHKNYAPYILSIVSATNWSLSPIVFGSSVSAPTGLSAGSTLAAGTVNYSYAVTAVDISGQESNPATVALANLQDIRSVAGSNTISWSAVAGASSYNVYRADVAYGAPVPAGSAYGFIGNVSSTSIIDSNIAPDVTLGLPVVRNPFAGGASVTTVVVTTPGSYTTTPTVSFGAAPSGGITATGYPTFTVLSVAVSAGGNLYNAGDVLYFASGATAIVTSASGGTGAITGIALLTNTVAITLPTNPVAPTGTSGSGHSATINFTWQVSSVILTNIGAGYTSAPAVTFSAGTAAATASIGTGTSAYPAVSAFFQQRLVLAAPIAYPQTLYFSQPGYRFNFNVSNPIVDSDAITASLVAGTVNDIRSLVAQPSGLLVFTDSVTKLVNGGSFGTAVTPASIVDNAQSYDGASDLQPIVANADILYASSKGSTVRDIQYNFYTNVFAGTDISVLASHLFFGYTLVDWCWAQEPYKIVWAVRNDGTMLTLTFVKDQEFIAWTHSDTNGGYFKSTCSIVEPAAVGYVNAVYTVVQRTVNSQTVKYIERVDDRNFSTVDDAWCVDSGLQYSGSPATSFTGGEHLSGLECTGLADGSVITPFTMPYNGAFTLASAASKVTVGLAFTAQLKTMAIDLGTVETAQGKVKKIPAVTVWVADTLGLKIGSSFDNLVTMKDLVVGNVGSMLVGQDTQTVSDLFTGYARTFLDPTYTVPGQYCIQQDQPLPATILGVIPQLTVGDTQK